MAFSVSLLPCPVIQRVQGVAPIRNAAGVCCDARESGGKAPESIALLRGHKLVARGSNPLFLERLNGYVYFQFSVPANTQQIDHGRWGKPRWKECQYHSAKWPLAGQLLCNVKEVQAVQAVQVNQKDHCCAVLFAAVYSQASLKEAGPSIIPDASLVEPSSCLWHLPFWVFLWFKDAGCVLSKMPETTHFGRFKSKRGKMHQSVLSRGATFRAWGAATANGSPCISFSTQFDKCDNCDFA